MLTVLITLDDERAFQLCGNLHIIISIYAQDILNHIAGTLHIHTIGRNLQGQCLGSLVENLHFKTLTNTLDRVNGNILADEIMNIGIVKFNHGILDRLGIDIADFHRHLATCQLLTEDGGLLQGIDRTIGIDTTLKTETGICRETMPAGTLTNPCRMEIGTLQHYVLRGLIRTTTLAAEDACYTHGIFRIANGEVTIGEFMLHAVKRLERRTFRHGLHNNFMTLHHVCIKGMQRLTVSHHDIVRDIHNIVDGAQTNRSEFVL